MKSFKLIHFPALLTLSIFLLAACSAKYSPQKSAETRKLLESKSFEFLAQSATPMRGRTIQLTSEYRVIFTRDSIDSHLPYFGTAYTAPYGTSTSPLTFSSTNFTYALEETKSGRFEIAIRLNEPDDPSLMNISVSPAGYATLVVNSINRQPISFYGQVQARRTGRR